MTKKKSRNYGNSASFPVRTQIITIHLQGLINYIIFLLEVLEESYHRYPGNRKNVVNENSVKSTGRENYPDGM